MTMMITTITTTTSTTIVGTDCKWFPKDLRLQKYFTRYT